MPDHPVIIQDGQAPVFVARQPCEHDLLCDQCRSVLIKGYYSECFISISIVCFRCGETTTTPGLDLGEIVPARAITLGVSGWYHIGDPVFYDASSTIITDDVLSENNRTCGPKPSSANLEISISFLKQLEGRFSELSGISYEESVRKIERYRSAGHDPSRALPFEWALWRVYRTLEASHVRTADPELHAALGRIALFNFVEQTWSHHPRYEAVCREIGNKAAFFHTIGQFVVAAYYYRHGLQVGFFVDDEHGKGKPDFYVRMGGVSRFYFELKSLLALIWDGSTPTRRGICKTLRSKLRKSGQINQKRPGAFVFMVNHPDASVAETVTRELVSMMATIGRHKRNLAGAIVVHAAAELRTGAGGAYRMVSTFNFDNVPNSHYGRGHNPLQIPPGTAGPLS